MTDVQRELFDQLLENVIASLPPAVAGLIEEVPVLVLDQPSPSMVELLRNDGVLGPDEDGLDLCGLHSGVGLTDRSVEDPAGWGADHGVPESIHLFRAGIAALALENLGQEATWQAPTFEEELYEEIRVTLLHELGHHFGLDEDDLEDLGYA